MSTRTRSNFKANIGPRIARSRKARRVRLLVVAVLVADTTKEQLRRQVKAALDYHQPCPVKVSIIRDNEVILPQGVKNK